MTAILLIGSCCVAKYSQKPVREIRNPAPAANGRTMISTCSMASNTSAASCGRTRHRQTAAPPLPRAFAVIFIVLHCTVCLLTEGASGRIVAQTRSRGLAFRGRNQGGCYDRQEHFGCQARRRSHDRADGQSCRGGEAADRATNRRGGHPWCRSPCHRYPVRARYCEGAGRTWTDSAERTGQSSYVARCEDLLRRRYHRGLDGPHDDRKIPPFAGGAARNTHRHRVDWRCG